MDISDRLQKDSDQKFGIGVMTDANSLIQYNRKIVPVSPAIDVGLGGGIPEGSWVIISGGEKVGKTSTALQIAANAQQLDKFIYFYTIEGRIKKRDLESMHNLDVNKNFKIVHSTQEKFMASEDFLDHIIKIIKSHPSCVIIMDSVSALCSRSEFDAGITGQARSFGPKLLASFCRQMGTIIPVQDVILIMTQHLIANTSGYGSPFMEDGGRKVQYQVDVKLRCKSVTPWKVQENQIGQVISWEVKSSALSGIPGTKIQSYLRYGYGLDFEAELFNLGIDFGLIEKASSWFTILEQKIQGENASIEFLRNNPEYTQKLNDTIRNMI